MVGKSGMDERLVDELIDELARCYVRAALNELLANPENKNADVSGQEDVGVKGRNKRDHTLLRATPTT